jgi:hypothetical protein
VASSAGVWRYTTPARDIIVNGGFEAEGGWSMPVTPWPAGYSNRVAYDGLRAVRVGIVDGSNAYAYSSARQEVTIPADALTATLRVAIYPVSGESVTADQSRVFRLGTWPAFSSGATAGDAQYVLIIDPDSRTILDFFLWDLSNAQRWQHHAFDLTSYAGETILLHLGVYNDRMGGWTGMYVDDVSLVVARPAAGEPTYVYLPLVLKSHP